MQNPKDDKTALDELIKAYQDVRYSNKQADINGKSSNTGKYTPIPLPQLPIAIPQTDKTKDVRK